MAIFYKSKYDYGNGRFNKRQANSNVSLSFGVSSSN